jgi:ribonuclease D
MPTHYITTDQDLLPWLPSLKQAPEIALDLEFDKNFYRYGFNLCLIQIAFDEHILLIDPLSDSIDESQLFPVLEDPETLKVVFAPTEDLRLLHSLDCYPQNLFDLDIATSLLNYPQGSLSKLIETKLNFDTGPSSQQSNWCARPLTREQKHYAAQDVEFLIELKDLLLLEADETGVTDWIWEENTRYDELDYGDENHSKYIREKYKKGLSQFDWYVFTQLMHKREATAKAFNRPSHKLIPWKYLAEIAQHPQKLEEWKRQRQIHRKLKTDAYQAEMRQVLDKAIYEAKEKDLDPDKPARPRLSPEEYRKRRQQRNRVKELKNTYLKPIKKQIAADYGQEAASFMLSNRIMGELLSNHERSLDGYKRELVAKYAQQLDMEVNVILQAVT